MKVIIALLIVILYSCTPSLKTSITYEEKGALSKTINYVPKDVHKPKYETVLIDHYRTINPNPLINGEMLLYTTKNGRFYSYHMGKERFVEKDSYSFGTNLSPLIYHRMLFLFSSVGKESVKVYLDGDLKWVKDIPYGIESMPVIDDTGVYIAAANGKVYRLNIKTGKAEWEVQLKKPVRSDITKFFDLLIIADDSGKLQALDKHTGNEVWKLDIDKGASYTKPVLSGTKLYYTTINGYVAEINPLLGKIAWERNIDSPIYSTPSTDGEHIYFGCNDGFVYKLDMDGNISDKFFVDNNVNAQILIGERNIYFGSGRGIFYCVNKKTFSLEWKKEFKGHFIASPFFWEDNLIVFSDNDDVYMFSESDKKTVSVKNN